MEKLKFGIMTDLHSDVMPDALERMASFIDEMNERGAEFIIQLGDLGDIGTGIHEIKEGLKRFNGPVYHVFGNHDTDTCSIEKALEIMDMDKSYYSFKVNGVKMIVLDTNHIYRRGEDRFEHFDYTNLGQERHSPHVTEEQLAWLEEELKEDCKMMLFSHTSLHEANELCIYNKDKIFALMDQADEAAGYRKVIASFSGHSHYDFLDNYKGTHIIGVPSISNQWMCGYINTDVDPALLEDYPDLDKVVTYRDPLYAFVTLNDKTLHVEGKESVYAPHSPEKYGQKLVIDKDPISPLLKEKVLPL